jgi:hypothetical protein
MTITYEKHKLYPESILIRKFTGKVGFKDIIDSWEYLCKNNLIDEKIKGIINDLMECELILDFESFTSLLSFMEKQDCLKRIKLAVITNNPKTIVFPFLGEKHKGEMKIKPFSTMQAAVDWIQ